MGGSVNIAARFNDGETICLEGWTNFLSEMIVNTTTLSGDDSIVRRMLREVATSDHYAGPQPFRRNGYGIVVIDFVGHRIHSMQGYTSFGRRMASQLLDMEASRRTGRGFKAVLKPEAEGLLDAGRVSYVANGPDEIEPLVLDRRTGLELAESDYRPSPLRCGRSFPLVRIDTAPFLLIDHPEDTSLTSMKSDLAEVGFPMKATEGLNAMFREGSMP